MTRQQEQDFEITPPEEVVKRCSHCGIVLTDENQTDDTFCDACGAWLDVETEEELNEGVVL